MGAADYTSPGSREDENKAKDMSSQFDNTISLVRDYTSRLEHDYVRPSLRTGQAFFDERPILATFCAIFSTLSFIPVLSFLGVSVFIITSLIALALGGVLLVASAIILGLFVILASVLIATSFIAILLTAFAVSSYFFFRFAVLVRQDGRSGISDWAGETKGHFTRGRKNNQPSVPGEIRIEPTSKSEAVDQPEPESRSPVNSFEYYEKVQG